MKERLQRYVAWLRRSLRVGPGWVILFLLLTSCDEVKRHKALTFFFDGVGPLQGEASARGPSARNEKEGPAAPPVETWHVHEPLKDCTLCHGRQPRRGFSSKVQLVAEVPQLCYQCHGEYSALSGWVHGPVAAGDCLLCHGPHKTKNVSLLTKPVPELCYQCHDVPTIRTIDRHAQESYARCTDCHEGHASTVQALLRPTVAAQSARGADVGTPSAKDRIWETFPSLPTAGSKGQMQGQDALATQEETVAELYYRSLEQYHAGRLREARDGFLEALRMGLLPDPMRETVNVCLANISEALKEPQEPGGRSLK